MSGRQAVFQLRLYDDEAAAFAKEAQERGLSKADLIRDSVPCLRRSDRPTRSAPTRITAAPGQTVDPVRQPGLAAIQKISQRLGGKT